MKTPAARREAGNVLLGVLLIALLISSMAMGFARHAVLAAGSAESTVAVQVAEGAADSGLVWAKQALLASQAGSASLDIDADARVRVDVTPAGDGLKELTIAASARGHSQAMQGTFETFATVAGSLPMLTDAARQAVRDHPALTVVNGTQNYSNTTLSGVLLLRNGARLTLTNCIVAGTIVSEPALATGGWSAADATRITLAGTVVIESDAALAGCSILAPDAAVAGSGEAVEIHGVIVCDSLALPGWGALHAQVASASAPSLARGIDQPGAGREPRPWPVAVQTGAEGVMRVSFPRAEASAAEQDAIESYTFPARHAAVAAPPDGG